MSENRFPTVADYYAKDDTLPPPRNWKIGKQPASMPADFHFGLMPVGLKNVDKKKKVVVLGSGDVWKKFAQWSLQHRGLECYLFDPKLLQDDDPAKIPPGVPPRTRAQKMQEVGVDEAHCLKPDASGKFPDISGIDTVKFVLVATPPSAHKNGILWAQEKRLPAMVEKPLVDDVADFDELDKALANPTAPVYCMDWEALHVTALAAIIGDATGVCVPFADAVDFDAAKFAQFDFNHIVNIEATLVEKSDIVGGGSMEYVEKNRPAIYKNGTLKDMGVHPMAALATMGFMPGEIHGVTLGDTRGQTQPGVYKVVGNGADPKEIPAWYARAHMTSHFRGQSIPTLIESGKGAAIDDRRITLTDRNGNKLDWHYGHELSKVELKDKAGNLLATAEAKVDPYAFMCEEACNFFAHQKDINDTTALHYHSQKAVLHAVAEMERKGRAVDIKEGDTVQQCALELKGARVDLGKAVISVLGAAVAQSRTPA